jgi:glycosyltransferase involved in cell wall biosynthesis
MNNLSNEQRKKIAILHVIDSAGIAGGERYLLDLIKYSGNQFEHTVVLPYSGPFERMLKACDYRYHIVNLVSKISLSTVYQLTKIIRKHKANIIHTHGFRSNFYGRIVALIQRIENLATCHVSLFDYTDTRALTRQIYFFVEKILSFKTSKFICISNAMKKDMLKLGISSNKTELIFNGVDLTRFYPRLENGKIRKELGLKPKGPVIGTIGRMVSEKGQIYLVQALKNLASDWSNLQCLFIGEGPLLPKIQKMAIELGVEDMCLFPGVREDVELIYSSLDIFVLPSLREPFGLVLLEAMASGVPVISTASGGPAEILLSGVNGILVPAKNGEALASQIRYLLLNKDKAIKMSQEGLKTVQKRFDIMKTVKKTNAVYNSLAR